MWISSDKVLAELSSIRKKCFKVWKILALKSFIEFLMFSSFIINASLRNPRRSSERVVGPSWKLSGLFGIELVNLNFHATAQASTHFLSMSLKMWCPFRCRQTISELGLLIFCALLSITGQRNCSCSHNSIISTLKTECEADLCRDSNPTIRSKYPEEGNCWSATGQRRRRCECSRRNLNRKKRIQRREVLKTCTLVVKLIAKVSRFVNSKCWLCQIHWIFSVTEWKLDLKETKLDFCAWIELRFKVTS